MILPIYLYGEGVLRHEASEVPADYPDLPALAANMFQTMQNAEGVGLAAPQVGLSLRMFVVDGSDLADDYAECRGFRRCMVNPEIVEQSDEMIAKDEGCLSIPGIYESVKRPSWVVMRYLDENREPHEERIEGFAARMTLHEYDHLDGRVFVDRISPIRKQLVKNKLVQIQKGKVSTAYRTKARH